MLSSNYLECLKEREIGRISIPLGEDQTLHMDCVSLAANPPYVDVFMQGKVPVAEIDRQSECIIHLDASSKIICLVGGIDKIVTNHQLRLNCFKAVSQAQKRKFFRVPSETTVGVQHFSDQKTVEMVGEVVNISASGILAAFNETIIGEKGIWMEIDLPSPHNRSIRCISHVIRTTKEFDDTFHTAFQFDRIKQEDQEDLVSFCFDMQRSQLRLKVRVLG